MKIKRTPPPKTESTFVNATDPLSMLKCQLNAAKSVSPIMSALIVYPGLNANEDTLKKCSEHLFKSLDEAITLIQNALHLSQSNYGYSQIAPFVSSLFESAWVDTVNKTPNIEMDTLLQSISGEKVADFFLANVPKLPAIPETVFTEDLPLTTDENLAIGRALSHSFVVFDKLNHLSPDRQKLLLGRFSVNDLIDYMRKDMASTAHTLTNKFKTGLLEQAQDVSQPEVEFSAKQQLITLKSITNILGKTYKTALTQSFHKEMSRIAYLEKNAPDKKAGVIANIERIDNIENLPAIKSMQRSLKNAVSMIYPSVTDALEKKDENDLEQMSRVA